MANPLPNQKEVYEQIKKENITLHPLIWELLNHHVRNDMNVISLATGELYMYPRWILKAATKLMKFLYIITRQRGQPPIALEEAFASILKRTKSVDVFLRELYNLTAPKEEK